MCAVHSCARIGSRAAPVEMVIPAAPATMPSRACSDAASSSAMVSRDVATVPQIAAVMPSAKPSPTIQNVAMDSVPKAIDAAGNREWCCFCVSLPSTEVHTGLSVWGLWGTVLVMFLLRWLMWCRRVYVGIPGLGVPSVSSIENSRGVVEAVERLIVGTRPRVVSL